VLCCTVLCCTVLCCAIHYPMTALRLLACLLLTSWQHAAASGKGPSPEEETENEVTYGIVMAIVVTELVFAFGVGVSCILFSLNLVKAVRRPHDENNGGVASNEGAGQAVAAVRAGSAGSAAFGGSAGVDYQTFRATQASRSGTAGTGASEEVSSANTDDSTELSDGSLEEDIDDLLAEEGEITLLEGVLRNFTDYLRVW
jgi:hypothetical protein